MCIRVARAVFFLGNLSKLTGYLQQNPDGQSVVYLGGFAR
jgi:hypothetical protein